MPLLIHENFNQPQQYMLKLGVLHTSGRKVKLYHVIRAGIYCAVFCAPGNVYVICYGLNCVPPPAPNLRVEALILQCDCAWRQDP